MINTYWSSEKWDTVGTKAFREGFVEKRGLQSNPEKAQRLKIG